MLDNTDEQQPLNFYGIDTDFLLNNIGGDRDFLLTLVGVFYEDKCDILEKLNGYIESDDIKSFSEILHSFLGAAANCGVLNASRMGREVYNRVKKDGFSSLNPGYDDFEKEVSAVLDSVKKTI